MPRAPSGAVTRIPTTATESTIGPQDKPIAKGTEPIAACTVAFGKYAMMLKSRYRWESDVPETEKTTPMERKRRAKTIMSIAMGPACSV